MRSLKYVKFYIMNLYLILLCSPKYCTYCKMFKTHFPYNKEYSTCPKIKKEIVIDYAYCFRKPTCELYFRDLHFLDIP